MPAGLLVIVPGPVPAREAVRSDAPAATVTVSTAEVLLELTVSPGVETVTVLVRVPAADSVMFTFTATPPKSPPHDRAGVGAGDGGGPGARPAVGGCIDRA